MKVIIAILGYVLMLSMAVHANQLDDAEEVYVKGNYQRAYQLFLPITKRGSSDAQHIIGLMYESGHGVYKIISKQFTGTGKLLSRVTLLHNQTLE